MSILSTNSLSCEIAGKSVVNELSINFEAGQVWGMLGRNGIGKTTLLHTLAGLLPRTSGEIVLNGSSIDSLSRKQVAQQLGLLLQQHDDVFPSTVMENVLIGRHPHLSNWAWESAEDRDIAIHSLERVMMSGQQFQAVNTLSGGERQRVAIATIMTQDPEIFLLDEPSNHLDLHHQVHILDSLVQHAKDNQRAIVMILHDLNLAARFCSHLLLLTGDGHCEAGECQQLMDTELLGSTFLYPIASTTVDGRRIFYTQ